MKIRKPQRKIPIRSVVRMAIATVEGRPNPLDDPEMAKVNPHPGSLDLPDEDGPVTTGAHSFSHSSQNSVDTCPRCGFRPKR
jgi:hypothetical protein